MDDLRLSFFHVGLSDSHIVVVVGHPRFEHEIEPILLLLHSDLVIASHIGMPEILHIIVGSPREMSRYFGPATIQDESNLRCLHQYIYIYIYMHTNALPQFKMNQI